MNAPLSSTLSMLLLGFGLTITQAAGAAPDMQVMPATDTPFRANQMRDLKLLCPDLKATIDLIQENDGQVKITGTVTNVGGVKYHTPSVAEVIMNLAYAPGFSYVKTGVSEVLASKTFTQLGSGASLTVKASYTIPGFGGWGPGFSPSQINARRLFTLRAIKQDMAPYAPNEDCHPGNNDASDVVEYRALDH